MPRKSKKKKAVEIPKHGRPLKHVQKDVNKGLRKFSLDVPLGNTNPTMVEGRLYGPGGSGYNQPPRGRTITRRGKRG